MKLGHEILCQWEYLVLRHYVLSASVIDDLYEAGIVYVGNIKAFCDPLHTILRVSVHDKMSTTLLDQSFLSKGNNLTNCAWNYPKFATLNLNRHIYKMLGADFLLLCSRLHKWPNSAFLRHICLDLASPSQISHIRWHRQDVDVPYLTTW